jgi:hypothetical protein
MREILPKWMIQILIIATMFELVYSKNSRIICVLTIWSLFLQSMILCLERKSNQYVLWMLCF